MSNPFDNGFKPKRHDPPKEPCDRCSWAQWEKDVWSATLVVCIAIVLATLIVGHARAVQQQDQAPVPAHRR